MGNAVHPKLAHRGGLATLVRAIRPDPTLFERLGGHSVVAAIVDGLYDRIESDAVLRPRFRRDLRRERANQKDFFAMWMGADVGYRGYRGVRSRHRDLVDETGAALWLGHFGAAMKDAGVSSALQKEITQTLVPIAKAMVEDKPMLDCKRWYRRPADDIAKGKLDEFWCTVDQHPEVLEPGPAQLLMYMAARRDRREVVDFLLDHGVDVNLPECTYNEVAVTPYCAARANKKHAMAEHLLERGAIVDVFTLAWLGDVDGLAQMLDESPELAAVHDPAQDYRDVMPMEHAVRRGKIDAVRLLRERGAPFGPKGRLYLDTAVKDKRYELVRLLLEDGVAPDEIGPGRWVLDEKLEPLLHADGADIRSDPAGFVELCTGHHGNPEQPELIAKLIELGADLAARDRKGRTALHSATRVGYTKVMAVLLAAGIDVAAGDEQGATALHYVFQSRPKVDRAATARVLLEHGADPDVTDGDGRTPRDLARSARKQAPALAELLG